MFHSSDEELGDFGGDIGGGDFHHYFPEPDIHSISVGPGLTKPLFCSVHV